MIRSIWNPENENDSRKSSNRRTPISLTTTSSSSSAATSTAFFADENSKNHIGDHRYKQIAADKEFRDGGGNERSHNNDVTKGRKASTSSSISDLAATSGSTTTTTTAMHPTSTTKAFVRRDGENHDEDYDDRDSLRKTKFGRLNELIPANRSTGDNHDASGS